MAMKDDEEEEKENYIGRSVKKFFSGFGFFHGKVISFNRTRRFYKVRYDDGDREELELKELKEILVSKESLLPSSDKPKGRRGRKRRRDSADKDGASSEAGNPTAASAEESKVVKILGYNFVQEEKVEELLFPSKLEEASILKDTVGLLGEINNVDEVAEHKDDQFLQPLIPVSLAGAFEKSEIQVGPPPSGHKPGEETVKKTIEESGKPVLGHATPPCRLKRTRVTPTSDSGLLQMPPVEDDRGERHDSAETVKKVDETDINMADVPLCGAVIEVSEREIDNNLDSGKDTTGYKQDKTQFSSLVLSLPPSSKSLGALDHCVAELFQVYSLLRSFSNVVFLSPFSLEEFAFALSLTDVCPIIDCIHLSLLQTLRRQLERLSRNGSKSATFTLRLSDWSLLDYITWPSFLVAYLLTQGFNFERGQSFVKEGLSSLEYYRLPIKTKLTILSFLCNKVLDSDEGRAELARRAILEQDPEVMEMKGCLQKKQVKESIAFEMELEDTPVGELYPRQGKDSVAVPPVVVQDKSLPSAANSIRIGRHLDEDGNLDECVLCAMDGNLICCDGCPAAYHSRCVGVTKQGLPPGDWFCPECRADKQDANGARISKGVRGGELLVVGPDGQLFFDTCGYLLVSESLAEGEDFNRYYSRRDLHKVIKILEQAGPTCGQILTSVQQLCQVEASDTDALATDQKVPAAEVPPTLAPFSENDLGHHEKQVSSSQQGADVPTEVDKSFSALDSLITEHTKPLETSLSSTLLSCETPFISASDSLKEEPEGVVNLREGDLKEVNGQESNCNSMSLLTDGYGKQHERKMDLQNGDLKQANGQKPVSKSISLLSVEYEKKRFLCCNEPGDLVHGEKHCRSAVDSVCEELDKIWKLHNSQETQIQPIMPSTIIHGHEEIIGECKNGCITPFVNTSSIGRLSAGPFSGLNSTVGLRDIEEGKIAGLGMVQVINNRESSAAGALAKPFSKQQRGVLKDDGACLGKRADVRKEKNGRSSEREEDYLSTLTQINASVYTNKFANCDFVATAAFNLAVMAGGVDDLVDDKGGTLKKTKPSSVSDQLKAFTQASGHFFWPSSKKRAKDVPKEKCGWCINCRSTCRRGCLLTQVAGQMAGGAALVVGGIRPIKGGYGHFPAVAAYILYMEENLLGLLVDHWESPGHRKKWRKQVEQAKSLKEIKLSLLQIESSLRNIALSADWDKVEEDAPESIANSSALLSATSLLMSKKSSSRKRGRPPLVTKSPSVSSYDGACFGVNWRRGGILSRQIYNWESLSRAAIKRAGRHGGFREISDLVYNKGFDLPRRTRRTAWRTRVEKISTIAQIAVEVRYLDTFIKWNDIISPLEASTTHNIKGSAESDPTFWKAEILAKSDESSMVKYLLAFPKEDVNGDTSTHQQQEIPEKGISTPGEKPNKKQQSTSKEVSKEGLEELWVGESDVPLFLLKGFEEKTRAINHSNLPKSLKKVKAKAASQQKKMSFWKMLCSSRLAGVLESKKLSSWICGHCRLTGSESQFVQCQKCSGEFHSNCIQVEDSINGQEKVPVCKSCIKLRLGQRMRRPSYKMLVMQSQLADGNTVVHNEDAFVSDDTEGSLKIGVHLRSKRDRSIESTSVPEYYGRKKRLLSVPTPSQLQFESIQMENKSSSDSKKKKKKKKDPALAVPSQCEGESAQVGKKRSSKRMKTLPLAGSLLEVHEENDVLQPKKKRGRKKKIISLFPNQYQREVDIPPQGRRKSGRIRYGSSPVAVIPLPMPGQQKRKRGRPRLVHKSEKDFVQPHHQNESSILTRRTGRIRDKSASVAAAAQHGKDGRETEKKSSVKRKRLKIIFAGLEVASHNVNRNGENDQRQDKTRRSGNGLDYGCRSARCDADIQRFRREKLVLADQVGFNQANAPVCSLCSEAYTPGRVYLQCEHCEDWFHGDAVGVKPGDAEFLVGFKCHRCRKCRAPSCRVVRNAGAGVKTRRRGAIDHGEVIDAESELFLTSFPDFVAATNQAEEALAADGSNFGHDVLSQDFDMSNLVLPGDSQLQLNPLSLGNQPGNVWASNGSEQLDLPAFSVSHADLSSRTAPSLSFTELLASEDDYFEGVAGTGLGLSAVWTGGVYGSGNLGPPCKSSAAGDAAFVGLDKYSLPASMNKTTSPTVFPDNSSNVAGSGSPIVNTGNVDSQEVVKRSASTVNTVDGGG